MRSLAVLALLSILACNQATAPQDSENPASEPPEAGPPAAVAIDAPSGIVDVGAEIGLSATIVDADGNEIGAFTGSWTTSGRRVATVSTSGDLRVYLPGSFEVQAIDPMLDVAGEAHLEAELLEEPREILQSVSFDDEPWNAFQTSDAAFELGVGETAHAKALLLNVDGDTVSLEGRFLTWGSTNPAVASIDLDGKMTALAGGYTCITVTVNRLSRCANVTVSGTGPAAGTSTVEIEAPSELLVGTSANATATLENADGSVVPDVPVVWGGHNETVVAIDETGRISALRAFEDESQNGGSISATIEGITRQWFVRVNP